MPTATAKRTPLPMSPHKPEPYSGPPKAEVLALRKQYLSPGLITYYQDPLFIVEGKGQYVWDETGKQYLDGFAGIVTISIGHCHPKVVEKVQKQVGKLQHTTTIYVHPAIGQLGKKLADKMPAGSELSVSYFTNSGSEADEAAILMAREFTKNNDVIGLRNGYHGCTQLVQSLIAQSPWRFKSNPAINVKHAMPAYCYRCPYDLEYPSCGVKCAHDVENVIRYETTGEVACFIAEPIQGVGGAVTPPKEYFQIVYDIVHKYGGLCIADEVQTAFGRTGHHYWGFENWGVKPDIVTMAKGLGNGVPIAAAVTRPEIAATLKTKLHFNTFGGNPISMTQGLATLEVIDAEKIQDNALKVGTHLKDRLLELQERHPLIGEVRGLGLMLGVELVRNRKTKEPANTETGRILDLCRERGLLVGKGGLFGNVLRVKPPMCITKTDADFMVDCLDEVLEVVAKGG
jgi:alanine-glyoxylate transaminase/(R)-3-amino-2-methylpropionate-pyruvate transaminase